MIALKNRNANACLILAIILCDTLVKKMLINYARNFIFTTGPSFLMLATVKASYNLVARPDGESKYIVASKLSSLYTGCSLNSGDTDFKGTFDFSTNVYTKSRIGKSYNRRAISKF